MERNKIVRQKLTTKSFRETTVKLMEFVILSASDTLKWGTEEGDRGNEHEAGRIQGTRIE